MKTKIIISFLLLIAAFIISACSSDNDFFENLPQTEQEIQGQIIHYSAKVDKKNVMRVALDGDTNYIFEVGDKLVITGTNISGELTINEEDAGKSTGATFEGDLIFTGDGLPADDLELTAKLQSTSMTSAVVDYSVAIAPTLNELVQKFSSLTATSTYAEKSFSLDQNSTFIEYNFTFNDGSTDDGEYIATISDESETPYNAASEVTVAEGVAHFYAAFEGGVTLKNAKVSINGKDFSFGSSSTTLDANKIYHVTRVLQTTINLATETTDVTIPANSVVTVTGNALGRTVTIGNGAVVTLSDVSAKKLVISGNATLILDGANTLSNSGQGLYSIELTADKTLTIKGDGSLTRNTSWDKDSGAIKGSGNLVIESGTVVMNANDVETGQSVSAISVKNFTMKGGNLSAWGGNNSYYSANRKDAIYASENIIIEGGTVTANGSHGMHAGGNMTISGGTVNATGAGDSQGGYNSGLSAAGMLTISGGTVIAQGAGECPGIGDKGTCGNILISGGTVTATGGSGAAAIGTGSGAGSVCGDITIKNTVISVTVTKGAGATDYIGKGNGSSTIGTIDIEDGANIIEQ
jgi:hypothetical protein